MDTKTKIMYYQVKELWLKGANKSAIQRALGLNRRTITLYLSMTEEEFHDYLGKNAPRNKLLASYEDFIVTRLRDAPLATTAQVHDWLKEYYETFPLINPKTVYNFVMALRAKHNIPVESTPREFNMIAEHDYGAQAQVDFGQYNMTTQNSKRKKIYFFMMMLSRSRYKFVFFQDTAFTTQTTIEAHEKAFAFFTGVPKQIVYDQDKIMLYRENLGELLLTKEYGTYAQMRGLNVHFCRAADPQSKGAIESGIKYTKHNFLYGRTYIDTALLQVEAEAWLDRTANGIKHSITGLVPKDEWEIERKSLLPYIPGILTPDDEKRRVHKNNSICYKGVHYSVPSGTYKEESSAVKVCGANGVLSIRSVDGEFICTHTIPVNGSKKVINNNHKRDKSQRIEDLKKSAIDCFPGMAEAGEFFNNVHKKYPRHFRDQATNIMKIISANKKELMERVIRQCIVRQEFSYSSFKEITDITVAENGQTAAVCNQSGKTRVVPLNKVIKHKADTMPAQTNLSSFDI